VEAASDEQLIVVYCLPVSQAIAYRLPVSPNYCTSAGLLQEITISTAASHEATTAAD